MKKWVLLVPLFLAAAAARAQWTKGRYTAGLYSTFQSNRTEKPQANPVGDYEFNSVNVSVFGGKLVRDNWAAGVSLGASTYNSTSDLGSASHTSSRGNSFGGSVFLRRYFPIAGRFSFDVTASAGYGQTQSRSWLDNDPTFHYRSSNTGLSLGPGLAFRMTPHIFLNCGLDGFLNVDYRVSRDTELGSGETIKNSSFNAGIGAGGTLPVVIGVSALF